MDVQEQEKLTGRKPLIWRFIAAAFGLFVFTAGIYVTLQANIGLSPWDVLAQGISKQTKLSFGEAALGVSASILLIDFILKEKFGPGTILDILITGKGADLFINWNPLPKQTETLSSIFCMLIGLTFMAIGQRIYIPQALGCGPRDLLMIGLGKRIRKVPIGLVQTVILGAVILSGWLLGGSVGIGTVVSFFAMGPIMQLVFTVGRFDPRAVLHDSMRILLPQNKHKLKRVARRRLTPD
jgi:uncharacterized membrane protein YczE